MQYAVTDGKTRYTFVYYSNEQLQNYNQLKLIFNDYTINLSFFFYTSYC